LELEIQIHVPVRPTEREVALREGRSLGSVGQRTRQKTEEPSASTKPALMGKNSAEPAGSEGSKGDLAARLAAATVDEREIAAQGQRRPRLRMERDLTAQSTCSVELQVHPGDVVVDGLAVEPGGEGARAEAKVRDRLVAAPKLDRVALGHHGTASGVDIGRQA